MRGELPMMGPRAGLWMVAAASLAAIVAGWPREGPPVVAVAGGACLTMAAGFLAVCEAIERRPGP